MGAEGTNEAEREKMLYYFGLHGDLISGEKVE